MASSTIRQVSVQKPQRYSEMVSEDRKLRLAGYEMRAATAIRRLPSTPTRGALAAPPRCAAISGRLLLHTGPVLRWKRGQRGRKPSANFRHMGPSTLRVRLEEQRADEIGRASCRERV